MVARLFVALALPPTVGLPLHYGRLYSQYGSALSDCGGTPLDLRSREQRLPLTIRCGSGRGDSRGDTDECWPLAFHSDTVFNDWAIDLHPLGSRSFILALS